MPTPPVTPVKGATTETPVSSHDQSNTMLFDFSRIDYELDRARLIGSGLWSSVYLAESLPISPPPSSRDSLTPPSTPNRHHATSVSSVVAVKCPARPDAKSVFEHEARILNHLHSAPRVNEHIVAFHGLDPRNSNLVFEGVIGGSLEDLSGRLNVVTELSRHLEVRQLFPGLARDLIAGLHFLHSMRVVHADIKPANILLDIVDTGRQDPVLRARYIDFSASFLLDEDNSKLNAGATWDFMAPEQLRIQKELNQPTFASDVWGLGITLLYIIVGGSPYKAACGTNLFMLREAIKSGDPLGFARMDPAVDKRLKACQDFVDCCRLALQKDRERRCTAEGWAEWLEQQEFETSDGASSP
ncbi:kinase-like domain-containing protein [Neohortaea acidophila]|uniref:Autophagy-related protein 1 n=1 Tax=Neohortaea acidophila TaxID=245834 RepID=A0A6A6PS77_9PEZI|nr:kinase-like domain-containing protein [Neohortaea acidophila]KAF2482735.1 kinase-like domain-containing protein [Neohortaea acidophila]